MWAAIATLHIRLLGDFHLAFDDAPITSVNSARLQSLLAFLVLHRATPQSRQHLAFLFWPDSSEAQARNNLRYLYYSMRQALHDPDRFLRADNQTIQWLPDAPFTLDVDEFERRLTADRREPIADEASAVSRLQSAVELYRGDLLPHCYDDWILTERERLRQKFEDALERLIAGLESEGDHHAAIRYARRLLQTDPLREETYRLLLRLHAQSGDRAGVVRAYKTCVTILQRELAVEPSAETRQVYEQALKQVPSSQTTDRVSPSSPVALRNNLPFQLTSFIGREREMQEVKQLLTPTPSPFPAPARIAGQKRGQGGEARLVTFMGTGGVGKTRLALAVAADLVEAFADGVWLVDLAPLSDPALLPQEVASVLGVREAQDRSILNAVANYLREKDLLLVLDNCEHLVEATTRLAETLLRAAPRLRILATSRGVLGVQGEVRWRVPSLNVPTAQDAEPALTGAPVTDVWVSRLQQYESVQLFIDRAIAAFPTFRLTSENAVAVGQICRRLNGIPLAIELAAARVKMLGTPQIAERLDDAFRLLTHGSLTAPRRQQTLRATMDWSYQLLSAEEKILLRRLDVFAGNFALEAAEAICAGEGIAQEQILDLLADLTDKSLVVVEPHDGEARTRLLETVRQYAREKLTHAGEKDRVQTRHLHYFLHLAEEAEPNLTGADQAKWLSRLAEVNDDLRAALEFCTAKDSHTEAGYRMASALWRFWHERRLAEGRAYLASLLKRSLPAEAQPTLARAKALDAAGNLAYYQGDHAGARALFEEALTTHEGVGNKNGIARALLSLGNVAVSQGDYAAARSRYETSLTMQRELGDQWGIARVLSNLGLIAQFLGDYARACSLQQEGLGLFRAFGDPSGIAYTLNALGDAVRYQGDLQRARALQEESAAIYRDLGNTWGLAHALDSLADTLLCEGDWTRAQSLYRESLQLFREGGDRWGIAYALESFAAIEAMQGRPERGARLLGAAEALREAIGLPLPPSYRAEYDASAAAIRTQLDRGAFTAAWAQGRALTMERAVEYALAS